MSCHTLRSKATFLPVQSQIQKGPETPILWSGVLLNLFPITSEGRSIIAPLPNKPDLSAEGTGTLSHPSEFKEQYPEKGAWSEFKPVA